jgi:hypothetical protein
MTFVERMVGAAKLDVRVYEEVEADRTATPQALAIVVLSAVAGGIGIGEGIRGLVVGTIPATLKIPGEVAKPIVRSSSPMSAFVSGSGSQRVPMK